VDKGGSDKGAWLVTGSVAGVGSVGSMNAGWVKFLTKAFNVVRHLCNGEGRLYPLVASSVVVKINEAFGLETEVVIGSKSNG
jgi:hypothetical protein